jgi:hypothetical protein
MQLIEIPIENFACKKAPKMGLFVTSLQLANVYKSIG